VYPCQIKFHSFISFIDSTFGYMLTW